MTTKNGSRIYNSFRNYVFNKLNFSEKKVIQSLYIKNGKADSGLYYGYVKYGKRHGFGRMIFVNKDIYEGNWKYGKMHGKGKMLYYNNDNAYPDEFENRNVYDGEFYNNNRDGYGKYLSRSVIEPKHNIRYEGLWANDEMNGMGKMWFYNNSILEKIYEGRWIEDTIDGNGTLSFKNGDVFDGYLRWEHIYIRVNDCIVFDRNIECIIWNWELCIVDGVMTYNNGDMYKGGWNIYGKHGFGIITYINGDTYRGSFINDRRCGNGTMIYKNGECYKGKWYRDKILNTE